MDKYEKAMQPVNVIAKLDKSMRAALITPECINTIHKTTQAIQGYAQNEAMLQAIKNASQFDKYVRALLAMPEFINTMHNVSKVRQQFALTTHDISRSQGMLETLCNLSDFGKTIYPSLAVPELNKAIETIHRNLTVLYANKDISKHYNNINSIFKNEDFSEIEVSSKAGTLVIDDEAINDIDVRDLTNTLTEYCKTGKAHLITGLKKSLQYIVKKYIDWLIWGIIFYGIPEDSIFHHKFYSSKYFPKPTPIQKLQIKQTKCERKKDTCPKYIVNRRIMPVFRYSNRTSGAIAFLCFGNEVTVVKSINKKRWLLVEWTFNGRKESGWVLGRYIEKIHSGGQ